MKYLFIILAGSLAIFTLADDTLSQKYIKKQPNPDNWLLSKTTLELVKFDELNNSISHMSGFVSVKSNFPNNEKLLVYVETVLARLRKNHAQIYEKFEKIKEEMPNDHQAYKMYYFYTEKEYETGLIVFDVNGLVLYKEWDFIDEPLFNK
jgi:hypothetical protein